MRIHVYTFGTNSSSVKLFRTLAETPDLRRLVRHVLVLGWETSLWIAGAYVDHLYLALIGLL